MTVVRVLAGFLAAVVVVFGGDRYVHFFGHKATNYISFSKYTCIKHIIILVLEIALILTKQLNIPLLLGLI